jgi:Trp operon repressor
MKMPTKAESNRVEPGKRKRGRPRRVDIDPAVVAEMRGYLSVREVANRLEAGVGTIQRAHDKWLVEQRGLDRWRDPETRLVAALIRRGFSFGRIARDLGVRVANISRIYADYLANREERASPSTKRTGPGAPK